MPTITATIYKGNVTAREVVTRKGIDLALIKVTGKVARAFQKQWPHVDVTWLFEQGSGPSIGNCLDIDPSYQDGCLSEADVENLGVDFLALCKEARLSE